MAAHSNEAPTFVPPRLPIRRIRICSTSAKYASVPIQVRFAKEYSHGLKLSNTQIGVISPMSVTMP